MYLDKQIREDQIAIHAEKDVKKTLRFLGSLKRHPGQIIFELNVDTAKIREAEFEESASDLKGNIHHKLIAKENCLYCVAINIENARRKFKKQIANLLKGN